MGITRTLGRVKERFYWPHMESFVHSYVVETFVYLVLAGSTNTVSSRKLKKKTLLF